MLTNGNEAVNNAVPPGVAEQRLSRGIALEAVAERTKISIHFLRAIEAEEFEKLPGGVYNTSYIRQYAAFTGVDEVDILARYIEFMNSVDPACLPPEFGMSRLKHALRRVFSVFGKHRPAVAADAERKQHILNTLT